MFRKCLKAVNYLTQIYEIDDVIPDSNVALAELTQPSTMSPMQCAKVLVTKAPRCGEVNYEYVLKVIFIEGFRESVCHSIRSYWSTNTGSTLYHLSRHATSLRAL